MWVLSQSSIPEDEEGEAVLSTRVLASPLSQASVDKIWVVSNASDHSVVRELLAREVVCESWCSSCLNVADESVAISGDCWHDAGLGREWRGSADGEEEGEDGDEVEDVEGSHDDGGNC